MRAFLMVGQVLKPQGIRGEVKVRPETDAPGRFLEIKKLFLGEDGGEELRVLAAREAGGFAYLFLEGVSSQEEAEKLRGKLLYVRRADAAKLPEGRYFIADLKGLRVEDESGAELGKLTEIYQAGGNDVYEVRGKKNFLFPALKRVILSVNLEKGLMVLDSCGLSEVAVDAD
ncbi:MAG: ribosome maturation factor RimM [Christensenellaceae bacterium]|jgi:16S rRNA processing protein RimM|nr:ribosome maturation factor RimM [Christensenellaceae bacterium]